MLDYFICLAANAPVIEDGLHEVDRSSVMQEEDALSDAPKRSGSELVGTGATLRDVVGESFAHVVNDQVRVKIRRLIGERNTRTRRGATRNSCPRSERRCMAMDTSYLRKCGATIFAGWRGGSGSRRRQHPHEVGKGFDVGDNRRVRITGGRGSGCEVERVLRRGVEEAAWRFVPLLRE